MTSHPPTNPSDDTDGLSGRGPQRGDHGVAEQSIRSAYERLGAERFYRQHGDDYRNPHEATVHHLLLTACKTWRADLANVLDLAAGSGEATLALREAGANRIDGIDPFTATAYHRRTGQPAETWSFDDIAAGVLGDRRWSLIVCSFAMHLCELSRLPGLAWQLSLAAPELWIVTPHKRPVIETAWGWRLADERYEERVRIRRHLSLAEPP